MKLIAENTEAELDRRDRTRELSEQVQELAANIMRVSRGAGRPHHLVDQITSLALSFKLFRNATGGLPTPHDLARILALNGDRFRRDDGWMDGMELMVRGGLQAAASELLGQRTQRSAGEAEIIEGLRIVEDIRRANRERRAPNTMSFKAAMALIDGAKPTAPRNASLGRPRKKPATKRAAVTKKDAGDQ